MTEIHDFDDTVVAILDHEPAAADAIDRLSEAGYDFEVLQGDSGMEHLDPAGTTRARATVQRLLNAFGDQYRVLDRLRAELEEGRLVVSVDSPPDEANEAVTILQDHGGEYIWKFGRWTFTRIGG